MRSSSIPAVALVLVVALGGCSAEAPQAAAAGRSAQAFSNALSSSPSNPSNPSKACALLAPQSRQELEQTSGSCEQAITDAGVPQGGKVVDVQVYGLDAMVELEHDTVFLALFGAGWRITAAGCTPQEKDRPYSCQIKGA